MTKNVSVIEIIAELASRVETLTYQAELTRTMIGAFADMLSDGRKREASATRMVDASIKDLKALAEDRLSNDEVRALSDAIYGRDMTDKTIREAEAAYDPLNRLAKLLGMPV